MLFNQENITRLFSVNPTIHSLLNDAQNPRMARNILRIYIDEMINILHRHTQTIQPLEWTLQLSCLQTFKKLISIRSEKLAKFSLITLLWLIVKEKYNKLPDDLNDGFFEELIHLFRGMLGKSGIYDNENVPEFKYLTGRKAALSRSKQLDTMAAQSLQYLQKYQTGLDEEIIAIREKNRNNILKHFAATDEDWNNYLWQIQHVIRNSKQLESLIQLTSDEKEAIDLARKGKLPFGITPYYVSLMDQEPSRVRDHAVRAQVIPSLHYVKTMLQKKNDRTNCFDFMLEQDTSPIELVTRRYPMIIILKPYNTCSQICVYCQRNWEINDVLAKDALATKDKIIQAINWIKDHPTINEVLVTGGDPLVMNDSRVEFVLSLIAEIDHVERIRIGSRTPVVLPQRITDDLIDIISKYHIPGKREIVLVTHFEHPYEITPESMKAIQKFRRNGMAVYNQAVFTIENSRRFELVALRKNLRLIGVDPYYTFNTKGKEETQTFRVPMARLQQEIKEDVRLSPGTVRTDEPVYNVPKLGKNYIRAQQHHSLLTILPNGCRVYEFHPWEKNLSLVDTYVDTDVSIYDYLKELKKRGENLDNYNSIWYYY